MSQPIPRLWSAPIFLSASTLVESNLTDVGWFFSTKNDYNRIQRITPDYLQGDQETAEQLRRGATSLGRKKHSHTRARRALAEKLRAISTPAASSSMALQLRTLVFQ